MSITLLHLIPTDPRFSPAPAASEAAQARLRQLIPGAWGGYDVWNIPGTAFIDPGEYWCGVRCPVCGADIEEWWDDAMRTTALPDGYFGSLAVTVPCCSARTDLNALAYAEAAGFARYSLVTTDPECELPLPPAVVGELENLLGTELRQVVARY
ncbi:hypothetical protein [Streptomyces pseudogriseolus]|uniref:hypothetical protein n=1 Tax=Streptomyces pseudogriseolus TaxID=36817 RepID=UPI003FA267CD